MLTLLALALVLSSTTYITARAVIAHVGGVK